MKTETEDRIKEYMRRLWNNHPEYSVADLAHHALNATCLVREAECAR